MANRITRLPPPRKNPNDVKVPPRRRVSADPVGQPQILGMPSKSRRDKKGKRD